MINYSLLLFFNQEIPYDYQYMEKLFVNNRCLLTIISYIPGGTA